MSDHEFEKQVHQKLQELKLRPSDTVWMEVEKNIRENKRRRRFIWLWSAALLVALTTSGVVLYNYNNSHREHTLEMVTGTTAGTSSASSNQNNTLSPNSTNNTNSNDNNNNSGTAVSPVQPDPGNASSAPANGPITVTEPVAPSIPNGNNEPGSTPPAAPVTLPNSNNQPGVAPAAPTIILEAPVSNEKKPAIALTSKSTNKETIGNKNKKPVNEENGLAYIRNNQVKQGNKKKTVQPVTQQKEEIENEEPVVVTSVEPAEQHEVLTTTVPALVHETEPIITSKAATDPFSVKAYLLMPDSASINAVATTVPIQRKTASVWHWGVKADAGYSRISVSKLFQLKGLLGTDKSYAEDLAARSYASPSNQGLSNQFLNVTAATTPVKKVASPIQPDFAASVGVFIQRTLSPRLKVSVGLEYSYMSVNTAVGKKFDSSIAVNIGTNSLKVIPEFYDSPGYVDTVRGTYASVQGQGLAQGWVYYSQKQRYRFHYIEIPVMLNWQINKGRRLPPIVFDGGVSIGRLFAVDALHYEGVKGVYYEDNSLFNRTQFNFVTGLSVGLLQKSKHPIWIGPDLRYSLNGLVKKDVSTGQYLWSTGISFKMLLGRL